jgi:hypothetical protein
MRHIVQTSSFEATTQDWKIALAPVNVYGARMKSVLSSRIFDEKRPCVVAGPSQGGKKRSSLRGAYLDW